ncbi:hypothetical protein PROFUN_09772 [Planoprotostelium fungivorum]|uniref:Uncharacterized protein n=1 Tax=Planoprotostelium fungivorum TaxID=1890364 RepID=A0A2P6NFF5_9EUKA|nr:hypothetical protein PROFUN_09772 [Planoprotostelium fungivorum]
MDRFRRNTGLRRRFQVLGWKYISDQILSINSNSRNVLIYRSYRSNTYQPPKNYGSPQPNGRSNSTQWIFHCLGYATTMERRRCFRSITIHQTGTGDINQSLSAKHHLTKTLGLQIDKKLQDTHFTNRLQHTKVHQI